MSNLFSKEQSEIIANNCYNLINSKANNNSTIQGLSGIVGFPFTLGVDAAVIPAIYVPLWNQIRELYGHEKLNSSEMIPVLKKLLPEIFVDLALDKFLGQIPILGIYFNLICAKTMTWRLGMLFTFLSSRTANIPLNSVAKALKLIRNFFPQKEMLKFATPSKDKFLKLIVTEESITDHQFEKQIDDALKIFS